MKEGADLGALVLTTVGRMRTVDPDDWIDGTVPDLALLLTLTQELILRLREGTDMIQLALAERMETDTVAVPGVGRLRRERAYRERWRSEDSNAAMRRDLAHAAATTVAYDIGTGEIDEQRRNIGLAAIAAAFEAIPSFTNLLVAGRRKFHLSIDDYRERDPYFKVTIEEGL